MPTYLTVAADQDLVTTSLNELGRLKFTDLMSKYQNTIVLKRIMNKHKMTFDGGPAINFNAITGTNGSFRFNGLFDVDQVNVNNVMTTGVVPWRWATWNWAYDLREPLLNAGAAKIVDILQVRRIAAFGGAILGMERAFWTAPVAGDELTPFGIPYWIVKSATAATDANNDGFNGGAPSGFTLVGGISPTTYDTWQNYTDAYTDVTPDDLIRKLRRAAFKIDWSPLVDNIPQYSTGDDLGVYTNYATYNSIQELMEARNENIGYDIIAAKALLRRSEIVPVKALESDTTNPVYLIQWSDFHTMGKSQWWMKETVKPSLDHQHTVGVTHTDAGYNTICHNRRKQAVLATGTTMFAPA